MNNDILFDILSDHKHPKFGAALRYCFGFYKSLLSETVAQEAYAALIQMPIDELNKRTIPEQQLESVEKKLSERDQQILKSSLWLLDSLQTDDADFRLQNIDWVGEFLRVAKDRYGGNDERANLLSNWITENER